MKNVLITGASGGIGKAIALAFGRAGYDVALHYRTGETSARETAVQLQDMGRRAVCIPADLADEAQVEALFTEAETALGFIGTLVNWAGGGFSRT